MKGITELLRTQQPAEKAGSATRPKKTQQLKWLLLLWAGSVAGLAIVAGIIWILMHNAGMTG